MDMDSILMIVGIVLLFALAGACIFAVVKLRGLINTIDTELNPKLDDLKVKVEGLKPVAESAGPLMESVNVTLDSLNVELVELDGKLNTVSNVTGTIIGVGEGAKGVKTTIKAGLAGHR